MTIINTVCLSVFLFLCAMIAMAICDMIELDFDYINIKIPVLRFEFRKQDRIRRVKPAAYYPEACNVQFGDIVITKHCFDVGIVMNAHNGKPSMVGGRYSKIHNRFVERPGVPMYGDASNITWYDTGIKMTIPEWVQLSVDTKDATGFYYYWRKRLGFRR